MRISFAPQLSNLPAHLHDTYREMKREIDRENDMLAGRAVGEGRMLVHQKTSLTKQCPCVALNQGQQSKCKMCNEHVRGELMYFDHRDSLRNNI